MTEFFARYYDVILLIIIGLAVATTICLFTANGREILKGVAITLFADATIWISVSAILITLSYFLLR